MARQRGREPAVNAIARLLAADIINGVYPPGARLPVEAELAALLGIGRSTVREAVKMLVSKGLLAVAPKRGTVVRPPSDWHQLDPELLEIRLQQVEEREQFMRHLSEIRIMFEPFAAEMAARRRSDADVTAIYRALADMREARPDSIAAVDADIAFHEAVATAAHNPLLRELVKTLEAALRSSFELAAVIPSAYLANLALHQDIADAIARQDAHRAGEACRRLIDRAGADRDHVSPEAAAARLAG